MKILAIADTEERCLWECFRKERFEGVDLILSAGDLDPDYLEFLVTVINKPLIYVRGNHDDRYARHAPGGCICVEDSVYTYRGIRIAGLGGSMRYRDGANMYTEHEMARRMRKLSRKVRMVGGCDILLTHAPAAGMGDLDDLPHRGFECFNTALESWSPDYMVHGHVHQSYGPDFQRERQHACGTTIINACGYTQFELDEARYPIRGWQAASLKSPNMVVLALWRQCYGIAASRFQVPQVAPKEERRVLWYASDGLRGEMGCLGPAQRQALKVVTRGF